MPVLSPERLIERFYREIWDHADEEVAREILAASLRFRGSLGPEKRGPEGFIEYLRAVHAALENFESIVEDLLVDGNRAAVRLTFRGIHRGVLFGFEPTGKLVSWQAAAIFETDGEKITALWLLGDVDAVKRQLGAPEAQTFT